MGYYVEGYKIVGPRKFDILQEIHTQATKRVKLRLRKLYWKLMTGADVYSEEYQENYGKDRGSDWNGRLGFAHDVVVDKYKAQVASFHRSSWNLDVTLGVHHHKGNMYVVPYCDNVSFVRGTLDFLRDMPGLVDYHYQNKADKPKEISEREWRARKRVWDHLTGEKSWGQQLTLNVCTYHGFWKIDPWLDLMEQFHKRAPHLPTEQELAVIFLRRKKIKAYSEGEVILGPDDLRIERAEVGWTGTFKGKPLRAEQNTEGKLFLLTEKAAFLNMPQDYQDMIMEMVKRNAPKADAE